MKLTGSNFFHYYIFHYNAIELSASDQKKAKTYSILCRVFSLGLVPLFCNLFLYDKSFKIQKETDTPEIAKLAKKTLPKEKQSPSNHFKNPIKKDSLPKEEEFDFDKEMKEEERKHKLEKEKIEHEFREKELKRAKETHEKENSHNDLKKKNAASVKELQKNLADLADKAEEQSELRNAALKLSSELSTKEIPNKVLENFYKENPHLKPAETKSPEKEITFSPILGLKIEDSFGTGLNANEKIKRRAQLLEEKINFYERIKIHKIDLTRACVELCVPWNESNLKYSLMMDDELKTLTISENRVFSWESFMNILGTRIYSLASQAKDNEPLTAENLKNLLLIQVPNLTAEEINKFSNELPPFLFSLINPEIVPSLETASFSEKQLEFLLKVKNLQEALTNDQLLDCVKRAKNRSLFSYLTDGHSEYLLNTLPSKDLDKVLVQTILDPNKTWTKNYLKKVTLDQKFYELQIFFESKQWTLLSNDKILELDFNKISSDQKEQKKVFDHLYSIYDENRTRELLHTFSIDSKFYEFQKFFSLKHWSLLKDDQILKLDFKKIGADEGERQKIFEQLYNRYDREKTERLLKTFDIDDKFYEFLKFFSLDHWPFLSNYQILKLDFNRIGADEVERQKIFEKLYDRYNRKRTEPLLQTFEIDDKFYEFQRFFSLDHWPFLSNDQILKLDFQKIKPDQGRLQKIFEKLYDRYNREKTERLLQTFEIDDKFYEFKKFFSLDHWPFLSNNQILKLNFNRVSSDQSVRQNIFDKLYNRYDEKRTKPLLQAITIDENFYEFQKLFSIDHWPFLKDEQILKLDFSKIQNKQKVFENLLYKEERAKSLIPEFNRDQTLELKELLNSKKKYLTPDQLVWVG